jgi:hypothetical protein
MTDPSLFDEVGNRQCSRCGAVLPLQEFAASRRANGSLKIGSYCPPCRKAYQHEWYLANREKCLAAGAVRREAAKSRRPDPPAPHEPSPLPEAIGQGRNPSHR